MKPCCASEAGRSLKQHRDVATCDVCGRLLLAYGTDRDFESSIEELTRHGVPFEAGESGGLRVIAKARRR